MYNIFLSLFSFFFFVCSPGNPFLNKDNKFIGSKYRKVVYREYTDQTFSTPKPRGEEQQHLEIQGTVIMKFSFETGKNVVKQNKKILFE